MRYKLTLLVLPIVLTACGGGGGTSATFTSWGAVTPSSSITINGISQSGTYTWNSGTDRVITVTSDAAKTGASASFTYGPGGAVTAVAITPKDSTALSFTTPPDTFGQLIINNNIDAFVSADGTKYALAANPYDFGWNYQSFGIWTTGAGTGSGTHGAMSAGAETAGSAIPTAGTATYTGYAGGRYVNAIGQYWFTGANMSADANFTTRSIAFSTTGTTVTPDLVAQTANNNLNMTGTLSYSAATNNITGNITTTGGLTGTVTGRFYGPSAQEIGGVFSASSGSLEKYGGAFGGKR